MLRRKRGNSETNLYDYGKLQTEHRRRGKTKASTNTPKIRNSGHNAGKNFGIPPSCGELNSTKK